MNKIFLIISGLIMVYSCCRIEKTGSPEASKDVKSSMKHDLFCTKYVLDKNYIKYDDGNLKIENAWIEKLWTYDPKKCKETILIKNGVYQFVIKINDIDKSDYRKYWVVRESVTNQILHPNMTCLSFRGVKLESDTLKFNIVKYNSPLFERVKTPEIESGVIIDTIIFTKYKE